MNNAPDPAPEPPQRPASWFRRLLTPIGRGKPGEGPSNEDQRRVAFQILFLSLICLGIGQSGMFAILPPVSRELGISEFQLGAIFAISATIWVFSSAYWGEKSDIYGRRPMIVLGLAAFAVSTFLFASSIELGLWGLLPIGVVYPLMIASRSIYGMFGSASFPAASGYVADRTNPEERTRAVANLGAAFGLGTTIGPGVIAGLTVLGTIAPLYAVAALATVSALAIWRFLPERTAPQPKTREQLATRERLGWTDRRILPFILFGVLLGTAGSFPIQTIGFFLIDVLKIESAQDATQYTGIALMVSSMAALFGQLVIVQRFKLSAQTLIHWGIVTGVISYLILIFGFTYGQFVFGMLLSGMSGGLIRPGYGAAVSLAVPKEHQGAAAGMTGGATASGFIFAPLIGNWLYAYDPHAPYYLGAALMVLMAVYVWLSPSLREATRDLPEDTDSGMPKS